MRQEPNRAGEMAIFVRVVEAGGFAAAARIVGLSSSAVSKLVNRLETRLGTRLLRRSTRHLALTPEGAVFHARAVAILAEIAAAEREAAGAALPSGRIRVNSSASYVTHVLSCILPDFLIRYPDIALDIIQTDAVADLVREGSDVAIRAGALPASSLTARSLGETPLLLVAAPTWIACHAMPATMDNLLAGDRLGLAYSRNLDDRLVPQGGTPERVRVSDGEGVRRLALAGIAPARLAGFTIGPDIAAGRLIPLTLDDDPGGSEPFHAVYVGRSARLPARVRVFLDYLTEHGRVDQDTRLQA